jgi:hypothetical protein
VDSGSSSATCAELEEEVTELEEKATKAVNLSDLWFLKRSEWRSLKLNLVLKTSLWGNWMARDEFGIWRIEFETRDFISLLLVFIIRILSVWGGKEKELDSSLSGIQFDEQQRMSVWIRNECLDFCFICCPFPSLGFCVGVLGWEEGDGPW